MRRVLLLAVAVVVVASIAVVAFASDGVAPKTTGPKVDAQRPHEPDAGPFAVAARGGGPASARDDDGPVRGSSTTFGGDAPQGPPAGGRHARAAWWFVHGLADRLAIEHEHMRAALAGLRARALAHAVDRGTISAGQRLAIEACLAQRRCDPVVIRRAMRDLRADLRPEVLEEYKSALMRILGRELDLPIDTVTSALKAQLRESLGFAVRFGVIEAGERDLVLRCFDTPRSCPAGRLRALLSGHGRGRR
jgi:hypothetical protein